MKYMLCMLAAVLLALGSARAQPAPESADALNRQKQDLARQREALWDRLEQIRDTHAKEADLADLRAVLDKAPKSSPKPAPGPRLSDLQKDLDDVQAAYRRAVSVAVAASPEIPAVNKQIAALEEQIEDQNLDIRIARYALGEMRPKAQRLEEIQKLRADAQAADKALNEHPLVVAARKAMDDARKEYEARRRAAQAPAVAANPSPSAAPAPVVDRSALDAAEKALDGVGKSDAIVQARQLRDQAQKAYDDALAARLAAQGRAAESLKKIAQAQADIKTHEASVKQLRDQLAALRKDVEAKDPRVAEARKVADDASKAARNAADAAVAADAGVIALNKDIDATQEAVEDAASEARIARFILDEVRKKLQRRPDIVKLNNDAVAADKAFNDHPAFVAARKAVDDARKEWDAKGRPQGAGREALTQAEKALDAVQKSDALAAVRKAKEQAWKLYDDTLAAQAAADARGREQAGRIEQADAEGVKLQAGLKTQRDKLYALRQEVEAKDPRIVAARKAADEANKAGKAAVEGILTANPGVAALMKQIAVEDEAIEDLNIDTRVGRFVLGELRPKVERLDEMLKLRADIDAADKALLEHPAMQAARKAVDDARKDYDARRKAAAPPPAPKPSPQAAVPAPPVDRSALSTAEKAYDEAQKSDALAGARKARDEAWKRHDDALAARAVSGPRAAAEVGKIAAAEAAIVSLQAAIKDHRDKMPGIAADIEEADPEVAKARAAVEEAKKILANAQRAAANVAAVLTPEDKAAIRKAQQQFDKLLDAKMASDLRATDCRKQADELDAKIRQIDSQLAKLRHAAPMPK